MMEEPEASLLVDLCRVDGVVGIDHAVPIDVDRFLHLVRIHAVRPTVIRALEKRTGAIYSPVVDQLRSEVRASSLAGLAAMDQVLRIVELLGDQGVPSLPFKGPLLAEQVYGDVALREFVDLDVLVRPRDALSAFEVLRTAGYVTEPTYEGTELTARLRYGHEQTFTGGGVFPVELQWGLGPSYLLPRVSIDGFVARAEPRPLGGGQVLALQPEDLIIALCVHASKHRWERLAWIVDLDRTVRSMPSVDWSRIQERAKKMHVFRMVMIGPAVVREVLGSGWTDEVFGSANVAGLANLARRCTAGMFEPGASAEHAPESAFDVTLLAMRDGPVDVAHHFMAHVLSPTEDDVASLRRRDLPTIAYVPVRLFRLAMSTAARTLAWLTPTSSRRSVPRRG